MTQPAPEYTIFADESGTRPPTSVYAIGAVCMPTAKVDAFNRKFRDLSATHGVVGELHWTKLGKSHGPCNCILDLARTLFEIKARCSVMVVHKRSYQLWQKDEEDAFYRTYTLLLQDLANATGGRHQVFFDDRQDSYDKHPETMEKIANYMLRRIASRAALKGVTKANSRLMPGIQAADVFAGAVGAARDCFIRGKAVSLQPAKRLVMRRLSKLLSVPGIHRDTLPHENPTFNIWHFPQEERGDPGSVAVLYNPDVPGVTADDIEAELERTS